MGKNKYVIEVKTGGRDNAGTDAGVFIQLTGDKGISGEIELDDSKDNFEKNMLDKFTIETEDVGRLRKIKLFHNNKGRNAGWFVDYVAITDKNRNLTWKVDIYSWLEKENLSVVKDIPLGQFTTAPSKSYEIIDRIYVKPFINESSSKITVKDCFKHTYHQGYIVDLKSATTAKTGVAIDASFFGVGTSFSAELTKELSKQKHVEEKNMLTKTVDYSFDLPANSKVTVVSIFYQHCEDGFIDIDGVKIKYSGKLEMDRNICILEGIKSEQEALNIIEEYKGGPIAKRMTVGHSSLLEAKEYTYKSTVKQMMSRAEMTGIVQNVQISYSEK